MKRFVLILACVALVAVLLNMTPNDRAAEMAVKEAVLDYVEGIYQVQPERIARSVDVTLRKYGYWRPNDSDEYRQGSEMNYKQLYNLAASWNKEGRVDATTAKKEVTVLDMLDKTASAKVVASWGIDYFHLAEEDGKWKIINVIWQAHPPEAD